MADIFIVRNSNLTSSFTEKLEDLVERNLALSFDNKWEINVLDTENPFFQAPAVQENIFELSSEKAALIRSAFNYPPALAIVRDLIRKNTFTSAEQLLDTYLSSLEEALKLQPKDGFKMTKIKNSHSYLKKGIYVWAIKRSHEIGIAWWVSWDFVLYDAPIEIFDFSS